MEKFYIKKIGNTTIDLKSLDKKYQKDPLLMINYLSKKTNTNKNEIEKIVIDYFNVEKSDSITIEKLKDKHLERKIKIGILLGKIYFGIIIIFLFFLASIYVLAKKYGKEQEFLDFILESEEIKNYLNDMKSFIIFLAIIVIIFICFYIIYICLISKCKTNNIEADNYDIFSDKKNNDKTIDDFFKD